MILLAMLFIFGSTRDVTLGRKIFFGISLGLSFELLSRIGGAMALKFGFQPSDEYCLADYCSDGDCNNFTNPENLIS